MKRLKSLILVLALVGIMSCRDNKKEEVADETEAVEATEVVEETQVVGEDFDEASEEVEKEMSELEDAVKALDSI